MKATCLAILFALIGLILAKDKPVINQEIINTVNNYEQASWKAGVNEIFKGKTLSEVRNLFGAVLVDDRTDLRPRHFVDVADDFAPAAFDSRKQWPTCVHPVRNQGSCGSCWAFAASGVLSDRLCIASQGKVNVVISPQDMVSCDKSDFGCQGGYLDKSWSYLKTTGAVTEQCFPYQGKQIACPFTTAKKCVNAAVPYKKYFAVQETTRFFGNVESAMNEIMTYGPIETGYRVYQDFFSYKSGVYHHVTGAFAGGHAVKVVGWGFDSVSNKNYWIVQNSWGTGWGQQGYFWIQKGINECGMESQLIAGHADLKRVEDL